MYYLIQKGIIEIQCSFSGTNICEIGYMNCDINNALILELNCNKNTYFSCEWMRNYLLIFHWN